MGLPCVPRVPIIHRDARLLQTTREIGKLPFELFECKAKRKFAFQFDARQAAHHAFISKHRYLRSIRLKRNLKSVKRRCKAVRGKSNCTTMQKIICTRSYAFASTKGTRPALV